MFILSIKKEVVNIYLTLRLKKKIFELNYKKLSYSCVDANKAVNFLNSLLARYKIVNNNLCLRKPIKEKI